MQYNSKNNNQDNNSIFKQLNTNIIFDYQKNKYINELIRNQDYYTNCTNDININRNLQIYLNGTTEPDENIEFMKTQRTKFSNLANKSNYNTNVNTTKNRPGLNRYNSYKRIATVNTNNNAIFNLPGNNNKNTKITKYNGNNKNKVMSNNHSKNKINQNYTQIHNNHRLPLPNNKKNIIPLGNNKYKTIGDNSYYSNVSNRMNNDYNINNNIYKTNFNERQNHNTIDINNLLTNHNNNINKKYNVKKYNSNNNSNLNKNKQTKKINYNYNHNYKNVDIKRNGSNIRPKTPDNNRRGKSYSRFNNNNMNNQKTKTPDRQRNKMKLNLTKDYLNTIDNYKINKTTQHYNYVNHNYYNNTIDNNTNNGKYKYSTSRLNTNDYFKLHKKAVNNYDNRQNMTITAHTTLTNTNSNSKKNSFGKIYNNGNQTRPQKRLSKNSSQGNILGHNNYNINLNSNGINHIHKNVNENYNYQNYHSNTNLITPIKYINQKSNFKTDNIQLTQIRPPNNYNLYDETFQSFGTNLTTLTNNQELMTKIKNNINENNNYFEMKTRQENIKEVSKNNDFEYNFKNNYNFDKFKELYKFNNNKETEKLQPKLSERNGNSNNNIYNTYVPATINNTSNKTHSYFNNIQNKNIKNNENEKNSEKKKDNNYNDIDFNDLDQFSPPNSYGQANLNKNIEKNYGNLDKYMNLGCIEERNRNYETVTYDNNFGSNRKVIDDFIKQLKTSL